MRFTPRLGFLLTACLLADGRVSGFHTALLFASADQLCDRLLRGYVGRNLHRSDRADRPRQHAARHSSVALAPAAGSGASASSALALLMLPSLRAGGLAFFFT
ncbi:hypothetical protein VXQ18_12620 [Brucella abortus]|nr:hypothetical protein [Brucella abortus]